MPFQSLAPEGHRNIAQLALEVNCLEPLEPSPLASLALFTPSLRELRLHKLVLACGSQQLELAYTALASLPHLELLALPSCAALKGIGALGSGGSRLATLEVWEQGVSQQALSGLLQLSALQGFCALRSLVVVDSRPEGSLFKGLAAPACRLFLKAARPLSLKSLEVRAQSPADVCQTTMVVTARDGRVQSLELHTSVSQWCLIELESCVLEPGLARGQQLDQLTVSRLDIRSGDVLGPRWSHSLDVMRRRFRTTELAVLCVCDAADTSRDPAAQLATAWELQQLLGRPREFEVQMTTRISSGTGLQRQTGSFRLSNVDIEEALRDGARGEPPAAAPGEAALSPGMVLREALQRMARAAQEREAAAAAGTWPPAIGNGVSCGSSDGEQTEVLLLYGPFITDLARRPAVVGPWLSSLHIGPTPCVSGSSSLDGSGCVDPGAAVPFGDCAAAAEPERTKRIRALQVVPAAGAVLVACEARMKHAVAAAAVSAAAPWFARLVHCEDGVVLASVHLGLPWKWGAPNEEYPELLGPLQSVLLHNIKQVLHEEWARGATAGDAAGRTGHGFLELAVGLRDHIAQDLPPAVLLS